MAHHLNIMNLDAKDYFLARFITTNKNLLNIYNRGPSIQDHVHPHRIKKMFYTTNPLHVGEAHNACVIKAL